MKAYRTIEDVLRSAWVENAASGAQRASTDRVLRSSRLEDSIYQELRSDDAALDGIEHSAAEKLRSFPALSRDVYQSFYSLMPKHNDPAVLSAAARKFNARILDHVTRSEDYPILKAVCEGRELPAYEAASEFIARTAGELDDLLADAGGGKGALNTLEKLECAEAKAESTLAGLLEQIQQAKERNETLEQAAVSAANVAESKRRQVEAVSKMIDTGAAQNKDALTALVSRAVNAATKKAEEVQSIISAWGNDPGDLKKSEVNTELLETVRKSNVLKNISQYLGRFREILAQGKRNGYAYGRGEKYSLELGRDLSRAITSELALLASSQTVPLFLRKYQSRQIKQYQRREPVYKGMGDMICCLDESDSTVGDNADWGKAVALTLLEIASSSGRSFALIHFSGGGRFKTDVFRPGEYTVADKIKAAETFLSGGTDFKTPMMESLRLMREDGFENADIVFITDGACKLPDEFITQLSAEQKTRRFTVTGILLDQSCAGMDFSLKQFCQNIYRTSELTGDAIVQSLITRRV